MEFAGRTSLSLAERRVSSNIRELFDRARGGDQDALGRLLGSQESRARAAARAHLGRALRADLDSGDVVQEAYLSAMRDVHRTEWRGERSFGGWLRRIISRKVVDQADRMRAVKRVPVKLTQEPPAGPGTEVERSEARIRISTALARLQPDHRRVLQQRYFDGLAFAGIAKNMGRTEGAVRKLAARALLELERHL